MNKTISLDVDFLSTRDHDYLAELFYDFRIEIDYLPQDDEE